MEHDIQTKLIGDYVSSRDEAAQCRLDHAEYAEVAKLSHHSIRRVPLNNVNAYKRHQRRPYVLAI